MNLVGVTLWPSREASVPASAVVDVLWLYAFPADRLEHVRARTDPDKTDIVFFFNSSSNDDPLSTALRICRRAISAAGLLTGWEIREHSPIDLRGTP